MLPPFLYAAVNHYTTDRKRKVKWYSLDLESRKGSKTEANHRLRALLEKLNTGTTYLTENMTHAERERHRIVNSTVQRQSVWLLQAERRIVFVKRPTAHGRGIHQR